MWGTPGCCSTVTFKYIYNHDKWSNCHGQLKSFLTFVSPIAAIHDGVQPRLFMRNLIRERDVSHIPSTKGARKRERFHR
jgi:hypothetical protein